MKFKQGQIVKSNLRTEEYPLFVMVLFDKDPSKTQFNGVILIDYSATLDENNEICYDEAPGYVTNVWNTDKFDLSDWNEVKKLV